MALLHGAAALVRAGERAWRLEVAHLDHRLRPASAGDAAFVARAADALGLVFHGAATDVAAIARRERLSLEEAGRRARYEFFATVAGRKALVATAHTADDAAETVLINLLRGSGLTGTRGIPARRGSIVRPLIGERRHVLREQLAAAGIAHRDDTSNDDPAFLRNRVRAQLLPLLEELRPGAVETIARFARLSSDDDDLLDTLAAGELARRQAAPGEVDWHDPPSRALGRRVLRLAIGEPAASAERIEALLEAAEGPRGGVTIELGGGRSASVHERTIRVR